MEIKFYCLYSGGKDSTVAASVLQRVGMLAGCVAFDTGINTPDWLDFIKQSCKEYEWPLEIYKTPEDYDSLVMKYGFPGPAMHGAFMNLLKGRCVRQFKLNHPGSCLASGVRKRESQRRWRNAKQWSVFEGVPVFSPIYDWSTEQTWKYFNDNLFKRSPAYSTLCISGDCLCGAFAAKGERELIKTFYPEVFKRLIRIENIKGEEWGHKSGKSRRKTKNSNILCVDCDLKEKS